MTTQKINELFEQDYLYFSDGSNLRKLESGKVFESFEGRTYEDILKNEYVTKQALEENFEEFRQSLIKNIVKQIDEEVSKNIFHGININTP